MSSPASKLSVAKVMSTVSGGSGGVSRAITYRPWSRAFSIAGLTPGPLGDDQDAVLTVSDRGLDGIDLALLVAVLLARCSGDGDALLLTGLLRTLLHGDEVALIGLRRGHGGRDGRARRSRVVSPEHLRDRHDARIDLLLARLDGDRLTGPGRASSPSTIGPPRDPGEIRGPGQVSRSAVAAVSRPAGGVRGAIRGPRRGRDRPASSTRRCTRWRCPAYGSSSTASPSSSTGSPVRT